MNEETLKGIIRYNKSAEKEIKRQREEIERLNKMIDLKSFFIQDLLELIHYSNDNDLHTKVHLTGIEYQEKLKELKEGK